MEKARENARGAADLVDDPGPSMIVHAAPEREVLARHDLVFFPSLGYRSVTLTVEL